MVQIDDTDYNLDRWLDKWEFILNNDNEMSGATATIGLDQLERIIHYEMRQC
jgi:hypothetical protein